MLNRTPTAQACCSGPQTILIVDDTPLNLRVLANLLSSRGYQVRLASSGVEALEAVAHSSPDLILLDIKMPEMDGYEVCARLKADGPFRTIPIIFLSALQEGGDKAKAFEVGGADYITKPFHAEEVIARVRHQLQLVDLQRQLHQQQAFLLEQNQKLQQEICDRTATEDHLNRMTSRLATLIRNLQAGILVANENQAVVLANETFCDLLGPLETPARLMGKDCLQLMRDQATVFTHPQKTLQQVTTALSNRRPTVAEEMSLTNGRILEWDYIPIVSGTHFQGHLWQFRDMTARKANEQALLKTSKALAAFSNSLKQLHRLSLKQFEAFDDLAEDYLKTGCQILNFDGGVMGFLDGQDYVVAAVQSTITSPSKGFRCAAEDTFCQRAICEQKTIAYPSVGTLPEMQEHPLYKAFALQSCISTPIFVEGQVFGSLSFFSKTPRHQGFTSHETEIAELMAQSVGKYISAHQFEQQRQKAEVALRESEARFRQLAERIENVFWILEPSQQRFTYISPAFKSIWGRPSEQVLHNPREWSATICSDHADLIFAKQLAGEGYSEEYLITQPDGGTRWIRDRAFPIYNAAGHVYRLVGIAEDITESKHQEQALRLIFEGTAAKTGREFFRSLARYLAEVLQVCYAIVTQRVGNNRVRSLAFWQNGRFFENCEYTLTETPCEQVLAGQTVFHWQGVRQKYPHHLNFEAWDIQSYFGTPLMGSGGNVIGHLAVLDNQPMPPSRSRELILQIFAARAGAELERQTFENEIQQAREMADSANRAKSEFLANVSHELRTPLNAILGFTQLILSEEQLDTKNREYLDIVNRSGAHLLTLINDVLEMSKIEAGKAAFRKNSFDLQALLNTLENLFSLRAQAKRLQLRIECDPSIPQHIETDESKLRQVLINLLGNAVKFTQDGHVVLRVEAVPNSLAATIAATAPQPADCYLRFEVEDTGPGIAPKEIESLFDPFIQTAAGQRSQEGTGLGLPISQQFVRLMGGELTVKTAPRQGSTFSFTIAAVPAASASSTAPSEGLVIERLAPHQPEYRLLVVEDQPANRLLLVRLLGAAGFLVRIAENGAAAVEEAIAWKPHLIWMDIRMPIMDGYEATRRIKAAEIDPVPTIIAITASAFEEERTQATAAGCDGFVRKPFKVAQIFNTISAHLPVKYLYRADSALVRAPLVTSVGDADADIKGGAMLKTMPEDWQKALRQAATRGSDEHVLQLIKVVPQQYAPLPQKLACWARDFQFDAILQLLDAE